jgi:hypothetical protein
MRQVVHESKIKSTYQSWRNSCQSCLLKTSYRKTPIWSSSLNALGSLVKESNLLRLFIDSYRLFIAFLSTLIRLFIDSEASRFPSRIHSLNPSQNQSRVASRTASPVQLISGGSISGPSGNQDASLPFVLCSLLQREFSGRRSGGRGRKSEQDEEEPIVG